MTTEIIPKLVVKRKLPTNIVEKDLYLFQHELDITLPPVFIINNKNVIIINGNTVVDSKNKLIAGYSEINTYPNKVLDWGRFFLKKGFLKKNVIDHSCYWIIDAWSLGYFHWLSDVLPRLVGLKNELEKCNVLLPEFYKNFSYVTTSLHFLGFNPMFFNPLRPLHVKKLITCTNVAPTGNYNPMVLKKTKKLLLANITIKSWDIKNKNIYISRLKASRRKVLNESDVIKCLINYGFKVIMAEDLSFEEQVGLFNNAENVVSIHGAGLANCLFMESNSNVLEFRGKGDNHNNCYYSMANANDLNYYYLECESDSDDIFASNLHVDIHKLKHAIELMLNV